ncbi:MAG: tRNA 4-thiouridine(8) synthase ThiI [Bacilli bacterium]|nr:tRNA 4-thiouridine(8) synthase ThiI [Bacilli bacterium]
MKKIIIIKYGELTTKKSNINYFLKILKDNVNKAISGIDATVTFDKGRMFIESNVDNYDSILNKIKNIFGIHEIIIGYKYDDREMESIQNNIVELLKEYDLSTFKVITKRSDKNYPLDSMEISRKVGGTILKNYNNSKVDVHNPNLEIYIEVRINAVYIYFEKVKGIGGYPVGTLGKGLLMLSGGIDSPVAGYMAMKRGIKLECIYFESPPHTSEAAKNKVLELARILSTYNNGIKVHVINFTKIQEEIYKNIPHEYLITIMRRMMYRISERIARYNKDLAIINGESVGQVASQTLTSMNVINEVVKIPIIRPVACFDKLEIIDISKKIGAYETSILPYEDCCTIFVPEHPVINPEFSKCEEYEKLIDYETLITEAIKTRDVIKVDNKNKYEDLL